MSHAMRKCAFCAYGDSEGPDQYAHSQLIWTFAPSLSTHRIIAKALIRLQDFVDWSRSLLFAYDQKHFFLW